jgi:KaiC/GvpD/RAD55 family RecA-like ATPase
VDDMTSTGIDALDEILGGGLPRPSANILAGPKGSGKTVLLKEIVVSMLQQGHAVSYYSINDSADQVRSDLAYMGLAVEELESTSLLFFVDIFSKAVNNVQDSWQNEEPVDSVLMSGLQFSDLVNMGREFTMKNMKRKINELVVMDSITPFFLMSETREVYHYLQTLKYATRFANAIGIAVHHTGLLEKKLENALYGFPDVIINMEQSNENECLVNETVTGTINVVRMVGQSHKQGKFYYEVMDRRMSISTIVGIV